MMSKNKENISVLFLTKYARNGASSRYRCFQYFPYLQSQSITCNVSPLFDENYVIKYNQAKKLFLYELIFAFLKRLKQLCFVKKFDLIVIEYELLPYCPAFLEYCLNLFSIRYIVDYDDALFHRYDTHTNQWIRKFLGDKIAKVMKNSALVIAGNDYLAEYAKQTGCKKVQLIPTVIDLTRYPLKDFNTPKNNVFTIAWIGSPSTTIYLQPIIPALAKLSSEYNIKLCIIGGGDVSLAGVNVEHLPWSEESEVELLQQCDVGIMPLNDDLWAKGKCGFKLIQYMACCLPVVASPVGINQVIVEHGKNGFLASTNDEWVQHLLTLYRDFNLRVTMGKLGRKKVEQQYCLQVTAPKLSSYLKNIATNYSN